MIRRLWGILWVVSLLLCTAIVTVWVRSYFREDQWYRYISLTGLSAMLPASKVVDLARRKDVVSMSPNRAA